MFMACGVGAFIIGIFHVMTHAFFKALMFLGAGSVIHGMHHEQDMRRMGNLRKYMPYTYMTFLAGWLAICGIIPFSGFWSKDEILWSAASTTQIPYGWLIWLVGTIAATCTAFYMTRLVAMTFWGKERFLEGPAGGEADEAHAHGFDLGREPHDARFEAPGDRPRHEPGEHVGPVHEDVRTHLSSHVPHAHGAHVPHESPPSMLAPLFVLAVLATIGGFVGISPAFTGGEHIGGRLNIVNWMRPIVWNPQTGEFGAGHEASAASHATAPAESHAETPAPASVTTAHGEGAETAASHVSGFNLAHAAEAALGSHTAAEWLFIVISLLVAGTGIGLGFLFYVKNPRLPDIWAARLRPLYLASYNKYWVDEFYGLAVTRRVMDAARAVYAFDSKVIDGAVNASAALTRLSSLITGGIDKYFVD
ncbi:MAG: proton-conducting transporter membrane subunit, partial [Gammaproteobacteria bacterium]